ncbi:MAG TPA: glutathione S-transferase family protein [Pseudorhodoplanes sp.]|jgi:glutathione S-transferase|nr:glutathione S-transferase family protein [Pseudorhodoplanes sp.]
MLILRTSAASPFGRKIKIAASVLGLADGIRIEAADTSDPNDTLRRQNPLGKIPILILDDGTALYDSAVIAEYLDSLAGGGRIIPREGKARFAELTLASLADGIMDASLLQVYENRFRPEEKRHTPWVEYQADKVTRALDTLEKGPPAVGDTPRIGAIALACALGYRDLRFQGTWRQTYPRLVAWLDDFAARVPAFAKTKADA